VLVDEGVLVMEVGGFDGRADQAERGRRGTPGLLGLRSFCQDDHRLEWCEALLGWLVDEVRTRYECECWSTRAVVGERAVSASLVLVMEVGEFDRQS
jgi:hypothetical protein